MSGVSSSSTTPSSLSSSSEATIGAERIELDADCAFHDVSDHSSCSAMSPVAIGLAHVGSDVVRKPGAVSRSHSPPFFVPLSSPVSPGLLSSTRPLSSGGGALSDAESSGPLQAASSPMAQKLLRTERMNPPPRSRGGGALVNGDGG